MVCEPGRITRGGAMHISAHFNKLRLTCNGNGLPFKIETSAILSKNKPQPLKLLIVHTGLVNTRKGKVWLDLKSEFFYKAL